MQMYSNFKSTSLFGKLVIFRSIYWNKTIFFILKNLFVINLKPNYGKQFVQDLLYNDQQIVQYLFTLMLNKQTRLSACQLIESILLHIQLLDLNLISKLIVF